MSGEQEKGIIGEIQEDGLPVIYRLVDELPDQDIRASYSWLTVVSWKYDGLDRNGMPPEGTNQRMIALEHAIDALEETELCRHAYSRTGNHLKELVYYISSREQFMEALNSALAHHPPYPIEINFYDDTEWEDFQKLLDLFRGKAKVVPPN